MTGSGKYVEVQSSGEEATYSEEQLNALIALGKQGIETLSEIQKEAIASAL
jgi:ribonuclease PH